MAVGLPREELLRLLGPSLAELARDTAHDTAQRTVADAGYAFPRAATVLSPADDEGTATVHIDGDPDDTFTAVTVTGQTVFEGQRILVLFGAGSTYAIGGLGESTTAGGVDLSNYVTFGDLNAFDFNAHVTPQRTIKGPWVFNGDVVQNTTHKNVDFVVEEEIPVAAFAVCGAGPTGSAVTLQWDYIVEGVTNTNILTSALTIPAGTSPMAVTRVFDFTLDTLQPGVSLPGILRPRIVAADSGNTAADITAAIFTQRA